MTSRDFCFWLQGYFEIARSSDEGARITMNAAQTELLKQHLALVFKHEIDSSMGDEKHQAALNEIHESPNTHQQPPRPGKTLLRC